MSFLNTCWNSSRGFGGTPKRIPEEIFKVEAVKNRCKVVWRSREMPVLFLILHGIPNEINERIPKIVGGDICI